MWPNIDAWTTFVTVSQSYLTTGSLPPITLSWRKSTCDSPHNDFIFQLKACGYSPYVTSSLTGGWVCRFQLVTVLASAATLRSEPRGTHAHIFLSQIRDFPELEGQAPVFIYLRNRAVRSYLQALDFYDSQGYGGGIRLLLHTGL
jgi:hypothetical protein